MSETTTNSTHQVVAEEIPNSTPRRRAGSCIVSGGSNPSCYTMFARRTLKVYRQIVHDVLCTGTERVIVLADPSKLTKAKEDLIGNIRVHTDGRNVYVVSMALQDLWVTTGFAPDIYKMVADTFNPVIEVVCTGKTCIAYRNTRSLKIMEESPGTGRGSLMTCGDVESNPGPDSGTQVFCKPASNIASDGSDTSTKLFHKQIIACAAELYKRASGGKFSRRCATLCGKLNGVFKQSDPNFWELRADCIRAAIAIDVDAGFKRVRIFGDSDGPERIATQIFWIAYLITQFIDGKWTESTPDKYESSPDFATIECNIDYGSINPMGSNRGSTNGRDKRVRFATPSKSKLAENLDLTYVCTWNADIWSQVLLEHLQHLQSDDRYNPLQIAGEIAKLPTEVHKRVYNSVSARAHPVCLSSDCQHDLGVALLSSLVNQNVLPGEVVVDRKCASGQSECHQDASRLEGEAVVSKDCQGEGVGETASSGSDARSSVILDVPSLQAGSNGQAERSEVSPPVCTQVATSFTNEGHVHGKNSGNTAAIEESCRDDNSVRHRVEESASRGANCADSVHSGRSDDTNSCGTGSMGNAGGPKLDVNPDVQLDKSQERLADPVEQVDTTIVDMTADVGCQVGGLFSEGGKPKGKGRNKTRSIGTSTYVPTEQANVVNNPATPRTRHVGTQVLPSQRVEISQGESVGYGTKSDGRSLTGGYQTCTGDNSTNPRGTNSGLRSVDIYISPEQAKALSEGIPLIVRVRCQTTSSGDQGICEVRETGNSQNRQRSKNDTGKVNRVQSPVRNIHKSTRTQSVSSKGQRSKVNSKGNEHATKSEDPRIAMEQLLDTDKRELRSPQVGPTLRGGDVQDHASRLSVKVSRRDVPKSTQGPADQQVLHEPWDTVQSSMRGHEWRHDHSTGKLHCCTCSSYSLPGFHKKRCLVQRKRIDPEAPRYNSKIYVRDVGVPSRNGKHYRQNHQRNNRGQRRVDKDNVVQSVGRWGRPRYNNREKVGKSPRKFATRVVDNSRAQTDDRADGGPTTSRGILSTQALAKHTKGNDARPRESYRQSNVRNWVASQKSQAISKDRSKNEGRTSRETTSIGSSILSPVQQPEVQRAERQVYSQTAGGVRDELPKVTKETDDNAGRPSFADICRRDVGDPSRRTSKDGANRFRGFQTENSNRKDGERRLGGNGLPKFSRKQYQAKFRPDFYPFSDGSESLRSYGSWDSYVDRDRGSGTLLTCGDVESNPGPTKNKRPVNISTNKVSINNTGKASGTTTPQQKPKPRRKSRRSRMFYNSKAPPGEVASPAGTSNSNLTKGMLVQDDTPLTRRGEIKAAIEKCGDCDPNAISWYYKYLDPIGTTESGRAIGEFSKIPDGLVKFSVDAEIRTVFDEQCPQVDETEIPLTGKQWSLTIISYPMFRTAYIAAANIFNKEFGSEDSANLCGTLNLLPNWRSVVDADQWFQFGVDGEGWYFRIRALPPTYDIPDMSETSMLRTVTDYRITYKGIAMRFNAPDLIDQGWWIGGHYTKTPQSVPSFTPGSTEEETNTMLIQTTNLNRIGNLVWAKFARGAANVTSSSNVRHVQSNNTDFFSVEWHVQNTQPFIMTMSFRPLEGILTITDPDYAGPHPFAEEGDVIRLQVMNTTGPLVLTIMNGQTSYVLFSGPNAIQPTSPRFLVEGGPHNITDLNTNLIELPPMTTQQVAANNPKMEQFLCKYSGGAYIVHSKMRNPVFELTRSNQFGYIHFQTPGFNTSPTNRTPTGIRDSIDQVMSTAVVHFRSLAQGCSIQTIVMQGWEGVTSNNTPFGQFAHSGLEQCQPILELANTLGTRLTGVYEEEDNMAATVASFAANALSGLLKSEATQSAIQSLGNTAVEAVGQGLQTAVTKLPAVLTRLPSLFQRIRNRVQARRSRRAQRQ